MLLLTLVIVVVLLVNSEGKVIGINTLKLSGTGIEGMGFAIPINSTTDITSQLIQYSKVKKTLYWYLWYGFKWTNSKS